MKKKSFLIALLTVLCLFLSACSPAGKVPIEGTEAPDVTQPPSDPTAYETGTPSDTELPGSLAFKGCYSLIEISARKLEHGESSVEEGSIAYLFDPSGNIGPAGLIAVSDDRFVILDQINKDLIILNRDGSKKTISLGSCSEPMQAAWQDGTIAVLDLTSIVFLNEDGEIINTISVPREGEGYNGGASVFEYQNGKLYWQTYSDKGYEVSESGLTEVLARRTVNISGSTATVSEKNGGTWTVEAGSSPITPLAIQGGKLLALTYEGTLPDAKSLVGVYFSGTELSASYIINSAEQICSPVFAMSPTGRIYMLSCFEDHAVISELVFE